MICQRRHFIASDSICDQCTHENAHHREEGCWACQVIDSLSPRPRPDKRLVEIDRTGRTTAPHLFLDFDWLCGCDTMGETTSELAEHALTHLTRKHQSHDVVAAIKVIVTVPDGG